MTSPPAAALTRLGLATLFLLLAVHAAILAWAAAGALSVERADSRPFEFAAVTFGALVVSAAVLALFGRWTRVIAVIGPMIAVTMLLTPGAVLVVLSCLLSAHVLGTRLLRLLRGDAEIATLPWTIPVLVGVAIGIGLVGATAAFKVHYAPVYALLLIAPLVFAWRDVSSAFAAIFGFLSVPARYSGTERGWIALLLTVFLLHAFLVARPEVGYDASTMHLQIALMVDDAHRFRFDVGRYLWAVMPLGADWAYVVAYMLEGEKAARGMNLAFGALACAVVYQLVCRHARRELALASVCLLASTPLAFAEASSLYVENLWAAFLLAAVFVVLEFRGGSLACRAGLPVAALLAAGAMQCKVIGVLWLAPLLAYALWLCGRRTSSRPDTRASLLIGLAAVLAAWPYANAWLRTGNPVFPFMNALFRSPFMNDLASFDNPLYRVPFRPWSPYQLITESHRFIEGADGAAGLHWLLLIPLVLVALVRRRSADYWLCAALAAAFVVAVYLQQAYLRYLYPAFMLLAVLGGWSASAFGERRSARVAILVVGGALCLLQIRLIPSGSWPNAQLCVACAFDRHARDAFVSTYMGDRIVAEYLNHNLPEARVGFLMLNAPSPAGFVGYSRAANWHDETFFQKLASATGADQVDEIARRFRLTHVVYRTATPNMENKGIRDFRDARTLPVWKFRDYVVAAIVPPR